MNTLSRLAAVMAALVASLQPSLATMAHDPLASPATPVPANTTSIVERGGTVQRVDPVKKIIVVDGVSYALSSSPVVIHLPSGRAAGQLAELNTGTKIRFNTSKYNFSAQPQVVEIWVTTPPNTRSGKAVRK